MTLFFYIHLVFPIIQYHLITTTYLARKTLVARVSKEPSFNLVLPKKSIDNENIWEEKGYFIFNLYTKHNLQWNERAILIVKLRLEHRWDILQKKVIKSALVVVNTIPLIRYINRFHLVPFLSMIGFMGQMSKFHDLW